MTRNRLLQFIFIIAAVAALLGASSFHKPLNEIRTEMDLASGEQITESHVNLKLIQAMPGIFRVLLIDYLWIQSEEMKRDGNFYDAEQKTAMICALQPRFPQVWGNRAWNLTYNVSVQAYTAWERWRWVMSGVELLRDKAIVYNPKSLYLYMELAQTYYHKLGQLSDDMYAAYWSFHAAEMHRVLGSPPRENATTAHIEWIKRIADAPVDITVLRQDTDAANFLDELRKLNINPDMGLLDAYSTYSDDVLAKMVDQPTPELSSEREAAISLLMTRDEYATARQAVVAFVRSRILREQYKLDPAWMQHLMEKYGPMDWRLVWSHSLYWASYGFDHCIIKDVRFDKLNTARYVIFSLKELVSYNRATLVYNPENPDQPFVQMHPDWRMIDAANQAYKQMAIEVETEDPTAVVEGGTSYNFMAGHENFLKLAINTYYFAGLTQKAEDYYAYAKEYYTWKNPALYQLPLERFIFETLNSRGASNRRMMAGFVYALIQNAYMSIAFGYDDNFDIAIERAAMLRKIWNDAAKNSPEKLLPPIKLMQSQVAYDFMQQISLESAITIWEYIPTEAQQACYDAIMTNFREESEKKGIDLTKAFPEPPGMEQYRQLRAKQIEQLNQRRGERPDQ